MTEQNCTTQNPPTQPKKRGGNRKPMTTEQYLVKARKKHGSKFDYSKTVYEHSEKYITLTCIEHGTVSIKAHEHLRSKYGCQECAKDATAKGKKLTTADFVRKAKAKHGLKYDYSKSVYAGSATELEIICPEHGSFFRTPNNHIQGGYGCNKCAGKAEFTLQDFLSQAKEVHGNKFNYKKVQYRNKTTKVEIVCKTHGSFWQSPSEHLKPRGCLQCAKESAGWSRTDFTRHCKRNNNSLGTLYVIHCFNDSESFFKIGITSTSLKQRFKGSKIPYDYEILYEVNNRAEYIYDLEVRLLNMLKEFKYEPHRNFKGHTECISTIKPVEKLLRELTTSEQLQLIA